MSTMTLRRAGAAGGGGEALAEGGEGDSPTPDEVAARGTAETAAGGGADGGRDARGAAGGEPEHPTRAEARTSSGESGRVQFMTARRDTSSVATPGDVRDPTASTTLAHDARRTYACRVFETTPQTVADLMSRKLLTVTETDTIAHLLEKMDELRFRHLPVVDGKKLVGLVTQRDLLHASSSFLSDQASARDALIGRATAGQVMQRELVTAHPDDLLAETARIMFEGKFGCLPVVDAQGELVGIITDTDFIRLSAYFLAKK
ncbi:MAG: CBS domain-containing protein [Myxococcota bacterium]